jgi:YVTN family beta-propeller protein
MRPDRSFQRRRRRRRRRLLRGLVVVGLILVAIEGVTLLAARRDSPSNRHALSTSTAVSTAPRPARRAARRTPSTLEITARRTGTLTSALQDAAVAPATTGGTSIALLAGLSASDLSTNAIRLAHADGDATTGTLPVALHDAGAAYLRGADYLFGGGDGITQHAEIYRVDARKGVAQAVASLPAPSSDQAVANIGDTAYVVGGYTGTNWLNTIVAFRPPRSVRIVAHLPTPVRYAAVTAVHGELVIAGGSLPDGTASRNIYAFKPSHGITLIGHLPAPTTHAAATTVADRALIIGGRGPLLDTPKDTIIAVDPATGSVRLAGRLPSALSDEMAARSGNKLLVFGGRAASGTTNQILELTPRFRLARSHSHLAAPRSTQSSNVYAADTSGALTGAARLAIPRIYVPNSQSNTVDEIDPSTMKVVAHFAVGALPQHVVPSYDLKTLYVTNDDGNSLTPINPRTGKPGRPIPVDDPYNMYFTPDGRYAIVVAERLHRLDFRNAHTFALHHSLPVPCAGVDHMDFSADGRYLIASCEFSGQLVKVDVADERVVGTLTLPDGSRAMPQDVKLSPDGRIFYVADMTVGGVWEIDGDTLTVKGFIHTGAGAHGLYPSRSARLLYVSNRTAGTVSVISFATRRIVATWTIPGGSPDMGGVSADGSVLWLSGRYNSEVYAISTRTGKLLARIPVGQGPHGVCVWPQPGRYSLGHTGILR